MGIENFIRHLVFAVVSLLLLCTSSVASKEGQISVSSIEILSFYSSKQEFLISLDFAEPLQSAPINASIRLGLGKVFSAPDFKSSGRLITLSQTAESAMEMRLTTYKNNALPVYWKIMSAPNDNVDLSIDMSLTLEGGVSHNYQYSGDVELVY